MGAVSMATAQEIKSSGGLPLGLGCILRVPKPLFKEEGGVITVV